VDRLVDFIRLHGAEIEKQDDEPAVFQGPVDESRSFACALRRGGAKQRRFGRDGRENGVGILQVEGNHLLRLVIFEQSEVFALQVTHRIAIPVAHGHIHQHQFGLGTKGVFAGRLLRSNAAAQHHNHKHAGQDGAMGVLSPSAARHG
jgi:hypothetical protein